MVITTWENEKNGQPSGSSGEQMCIGQEVSLLMTSFLCMDEGK